MFVFRLQSHCSVFLALVLCGVLFAQPTEREDSSTQGWRKTRAEIFDRIEQEVKEQVEATVTLEDAAASLNLELPVPEPEKSAAEIFAETRKEAEKTALAARPLKELQTIVHEAERLYPLYKIGDQVSIRTRIKVYPVATGVVAAISAERVRIGSRWIPIRDIAEEQRHGFDEIKTGDLRQNFVAKQNNLQMAILQNATNDLFVKKIPINMREAGYFPDGDEQEKLLRPEGWTTAKAVLQQELTRLRAEATAKLRPAVEKQIFTENRFKYHENKKEWRPTGILQGLKNLFE